MKRYYVKREVVWNEDSSYIGWVVCDRTLKEDDDVICEASSRRKAYKISKALNDSKCLCETCCQRGCRGVEIPWKGKWTMHECEGYKIQPKGIKYI